MKPYFFILLSFISYNIFSQVTYNVPEILYLKFNNGSTTTPDYASPGAGCPSANIYGMTLANGGMFDSALIGADLNSNISFVENKWATYLPPTGWTIGLWISNLSVPPVSTNPVYLFGEGDPGADNFRCFWAGAAIGPTDTGVALRKGTLNVRVPVPTNGDSYLHFVYDPVAGNVRGYRNGQLIITVAQAQMTVAGNGPFKVAGHLTFSSLSDGMKMDEFRIYNRVLSAAEIANTWNHTLPYTVTSINRISEKLPSEFALYQNYPNPFNPITKVRFSIAGSSGMRPQLVRIDIFNTMGQLVTTLVNTELFPGEYETEWDASDYPSGAYYYTLIAGSYKETRTLVMIK